MGRRMFENWLIGENSIAILHRKMARKGSCYFPGKSGAIIVKGIPLVKLESSEQISQHFMFKPCLMQIYLC